MFFKFPTLKKLFLASLLFLTTFSYSQSTIWQEDFTYPDNTTSGTGNRWTTTTSGGLDWFEVRSNIFEGRDLDGEQVFETEAIDISSYSNISLNVDLWEIGNHESDDYLRVYYQLDTGLGFGAEILFATNGNNNGNWNSRVASQTGLNGQRIKIIIKADNDRNSEYFRFDNILVQGTFSCVKPFIGGTATQSSTYSGTALASRARDGNTSGDWINNSVSHTNYDNNPWWMLDLGVDKIIDNVIIYNRTDCCGTRLDNFILEVLDASNNVVYTHTNGAATITNTVSNISTLGRKIRIRLTGNQFLQLAEVVVNIDDCSITPPTIGTITQPNCTTSTGSVVLNDLPNGTWILTQNPGGIETLGTGTSTTISGLSEGTYSYTVKKAGLTAEYFNNTTLSGQPVITRTDATVDFDWGNNSPDNLINNDVFSVRWSGEVQPLVSDNYIFRTNSDDGVRLWVNGALVINNWNDYPATYNYSASIALVAGQKYTIILEYYENAGQAIAQLEWNRSSNTTYQTIPQSQLFPNSTSNLIASNNVVINAQPLNNWTGALNKNWNNAANWTCGIPTNTSNVVIPSGLINYPEIYDGDNEGLSNNIEFEAGTSLIIYNNYINISGELLLNGFIDLDGEAQLIQTTGSIFNTASTGYIERDQQGVGNKYRYNDWSSPVSSNAATQTYTVGSVLKDGTDASNPVNINFVGGYNGDNTTTPIQIANYWIYKYANDDHDNYSKWNQIGSTGSLKAGEGYLMKGTGNPGSADQNYVFVGKPNNGDITLTVAGTNDYLIGNPYPSAIDADAFILDNANSIEGGTIYFWEHYGGNSHNLKDYQAGYGYYNFSGGVRASSHPINDPNGGRGSKTPGRYIAVGQGFFVQGDADGGDIVFKNSQRAFVTEDNPSNSIFLKASQTKKGATSNQKNIDDRLKIRLLLESNSQQRRELLLTIDERASDAIDWGFDAPIYEEFAEDMYWPIENGKYIIQGTNNFTLDKEVPLAIKSIGELVEIKIDSLENIDENIEIYIKDSETGILHDIKNQNFEITLPKGEYVNRFSIVFETQSTLGFEDEVLENKIQVFMDNTNSELHIKNTTNSEIQSAVLYNILGQTVKFWSGNNLLNKTTALPVNVNAGAYIVKLATSQGAISKKIVIQ
jgi:hypothetical protein